MRVSNDEYFGTKVQISKIITVQNNYFFEKHRVSGESNGVTKNNKKFVALMNDVRRILSQVSAETLTQLIDSDSKFSEMEITTKLPEIRFKNGDGLECVNGRWQYRSIRNYNAQEPPTLVQYVALTYKNEVKVLVGISREINAPANVYHWNIIHTAPGLVGGVAKNGDDTDIRTGISAVVESITKFSN
ncbi:hypothetical protein [Microcystis phage Mel-JY01]